jgi:hypothetical protein
MAFRPLVSRLFAAAVCALGTHAFVYGTFLPADGAHGYFAWYESAIALLSLASLVALSLLLAASLTGRLVVHVRPKAFGERVRELAGWTLLFLLTQETLEHSLQAGRPVLVTFALSAWLVLVAGVAATSVALAAALHLGCAVVERCAPARLRIVAVLRALSWSLVTNERRRERPLAGRFALRAPPLPQS